MSRRPSRAVLGNLIVMVLLAVAGYALLRLHLGETWWQGAPPARYWQGALLATALYALACTALWWRGRPRDDAPSNDVAPLLLVWSSQTGFARELAERSAEALRAASLPVRVRGLHEVDAALLAQSQRALFIASTTGEGDAPDHALPFLRRVMSTSPTLGHLQFGVLALGDRSYGHFCAFGHQLDDWLRQHGAHPMFDAIEVDNADPAALRHWQQLLGQIGGGASELPDWSPADYQPWPLLQREHLNPGSSGGPVYWLRLQPPPGSDAQWQAGDIAEVGPQHAAASTRDWLRERDFNPELPLDDGRTLLDHVVRSHLPSLVAPGDLPGLLAALQPLPHREYSIASVMAHGALELLLRRQLRADGTPGIGSGWLCDHAVLHEPVQLRLRRNQNFHGVAAEVPLLLIGNGTGIAGLRAHLHERARGGARRTWLLFGERSAAHDFHFGDELQAMLAEGALARLDAVFSRDGGAHRYVQDRLLAEAATLRQWVEEGATILVCGSLQGMAPAVDAVIEQVLGADGKEALLLAGRYRRDVY
ncbi:sulfite reductase flavoprotein subunit alpha [Stenotrophomonas cyclobalanopsidis]|uniref:NADPH--hemoprotein reductase n=1 Tax=Stenotrophomonas cyclobalanopsidis TaxID=2771362 RepID=A0ABQ6T2A0_9GAMM|nr:sulfite reductase subunit alpha [Stenotrophomonas cyclobalanopsidis]KAA9000250.1 sulfite reductase flavoprotein subunit alpha [Stenotrophomonas cyclobalanopsidis]